jgi:hypothetical protein
MRTTTEIGDTDQGYWTVVSDEPEYHQPSILTKAADIEAGSYAPNGSMLTRPRRIKAIWTRNSDGKQFAVKLRLFKMPAGASTISIGAVTYGTDGTATYTPSKEGYFITEDGVLITNGELQRNVAGLLLTDYYLAHWDDPNHRQFARVTSLEEGDLFWVIVETSADSDYGWTVYSDAAVATAGLAIVASGSNDGQVTPAGAISTTSVGAFAASLKNNMFELDACKLGTALETSSGAGLVKAHVKILNKVL